MFIKENFKTINNFSLDELHKKVGQILFIEPSESDMAEGNFNQQLLFIDENKNVYILFEDDIRNGGK